MTTMQIAQEADKLMEVENVTSATKGYKGFPGSLCVSPNEIVCHGIPNERILQDGDIVSIDITVIKEGYFGDTCATFMVGNVKNKHKKLIQAAQDALQKGIEQVYPGNHFGNIGYRISRSMRNRGFGVVREFCGHGIGISFHEEPVVCHVAAKDSGEVMQPGMIFTIEPMINEGTGDIFIDQTDFWTAKTKDKKWSAQFEHTLLVTDSGVEVLTI